MSASPVLIAELELYHSRPIAPTRRVALGRSLLPVDPAPGPGGVLLAAVVATFLPQVDEDFYTDYDKLLGQLERGERIPQPRLRHRVQKDRVGLTRSRHRLLRSSSGLQFSLQTDRGAPEQHALAAAYAAGQLDHGARRVVLDSLRVASAWRAEVGGRFIATITGNGALPRLALADPVGWALGVLGFGDEMSPARSAVQRQFRDLLRDAHPDTGGHHDAAAQRIRDLTEARRILLAS